jgi:glycosyltransferase involved in cell wall biosynthesis
MNILFVSEYLLPPLGGGQVCFWNIAKELAKRHRVYAITNRGNNAEKHEIIDDVEIIRLPPSQALNNPNPLKLLIFSMVLYFYLFRFLKKNKIDIVHNNGGIITLPTTYAASHYHIPVVTSVFSVPGAFKRKIYNPFLSLAMDINTVAILRFGKHDVIQFDAEYTKIQTRRYVKAKTVVIPTSFVNGKEIEEIKKDINTEEIKQKMGIKDNELFILFVGRLSRIKNVTGLIKVLVNLKKGFKLVLVGDGPERGNIEKLVKDFGLERKVRMIGQRPHEKTLSIIRACDVLILPSLMEQFPQVVLEGLALEKPVIATNVGGIPEIKSESLYLVDNLEEINRILEGGNQLKTGEGDKIVEEYSLDKMVQKFENVYTSLVHK